MVQFQFAKIFRSSRFWGTCGAIALAFWAGYLTGQHRHSLLREPPISITASDMRGAFGTSPVAGLPLPALSNAAPMPSPMRADSLSDLVSGLEKKVSSNPTNLDDQLLLARTYQELGERDKALTLLGRLHQRYSGANVDVNFLYATVLMSGTRSEQLEAYKLFDYAAAKKPELKSLSRLHQGEIEISLGHTKNALQIWKESLAKLPSGSNQRTLFEQRIAKYSKR
jgi:cytochrome c-type biogenesis protein CcmH/NrfG